MAPYCLFSSKGGYTLNYSTAISTSNSPGFTSFYDARQTLSKIIDSKTCCTKCSSSDFCFVYDYNTATKSCVLYAPTNKVTQKNDSQIIARYLVKNSKRVSGYYF